jgi:SAM-dependent methyltransferase
LMPTPALSLEEKYSQSAVVEFWTRLAESGLQAAEEAMLARYAPPAPARVLDIGCGAGRVSLALVPRRYTVTGIDIAAPMVAAAQSLARKHSLPSQFARANLCDLPFSDDSFDFALIFIAALQHVWGRAQRQDAFRQVARILRQDGVLILALDNLAPALSCYASWAMAKLLSHRPSAVHPVWSTVNRSPSAVGRERADHMLAANREKMSRLAWRGRGLARTLRWRTWEGLRDMARTLRMIGGEQGDTQIAQVSMPPTEGRVYYHLYRHIELIEDAQVAGLCLLGYHSGNELAENQTFEETARRLDKQVLYAFHNSHLS